MRILLINSNRFKNPEPVIPIGLCYIASSIENSGHTVKVLDLCFSINNEKDIKNTISNFNPDINGVYFWVLLKKQKKPFQNPSKQ